MTKQASPILAVVFDFDGVVLESADVKTDAFVELFAHHGHDIAEQVRAHHLANLGISRFVKFAWIYENLLRQPLSEADSARLGQAFSDLALAKILEAPFVPGADRALAQLAPRLPLFVASGTPQGELDHIVDARGLRPHFREVWGTPTEKPTILRDLMARHGWTAEQVLFIGDGMSDFKAASAVGTAFLARDTPALHADWTRLGVRMRPDLTDLSEVVASW